MNNSSDYPDWFLWLYQRGFVLFQIVLGVLAVVLVAAAFFINSRLQNIETQLSFQPNGPASVAEDTELPEYIAKGQTVYVPVYSHVYHQGGTGFPLTVTLSIRNSDVAHPIVISSIDYYDTKGKLVKKYLSKPARLAALASLEYLVEEGDVAGGSGAKFLVAWVAEENVHEPLIQAVMIGTSGTQGISFVTTGEVLKQEKE